MPNQKISLDTTVPLKPGMLVPAVDMTLAPGFQNVNVLGSSINPFAYNANYAVYSTGDSAGHIASLVFNATNTGGHASYDTALIGGCYIVDGSGSPSPSPTNVDWAMQLSLLKTNWQTSVLHGELDGISIVVRNGLDDCAGFIANVGNIQGFSTVLEGVSNTFGVGGSGIVRAVRVQLAAIETGESGSPLAAGAILIAQNGTSDVGLQIQASSTGIFTNAIRCINQSSNVYFSVDKFGSINIVDTTNTLAVQIGIDDPTGAFSIRSSGGALTENLNLSQSGNLSIRGTFQQNAVQVVGARQTGWTVGTGATPNTAAMNYGSATLAQLAARVMALEAALTAHGLIGT